MAYPSDIGLVGAIPLTCAVTCLPSAVAADYKPLKRLGGVGGGRLGCHRETRGSRGGGSEILMGPGG